MTRDVGKGTGSDRSEAKSGPSRSRELTTHSEKRTEHRETAETTAKRKYSEKKTERKEVPESLSRRKLPEKKPLRKEIPEQLRPKELRPRTRPSDKPALPTNKIESGKKHLQGDLRKIPEKTYVVKDEAKALRNRIDAKRKRVMGDRAEKRCLKSLKRFYGCKVAGQDLQMGRQGIDAYGIRNKPRRGRSLILTEVKSTENEKARGKTKEIRRLLKVGKRDNLQQGSSGYAMSRLERAAKGGNPVARSLLAELKSGSIKDVQNKVYWVNMKTGKERWFESVPNRRENRVSRLKPEYNIQARKRSEHIEKVKSFLN